MRLLRLVLVGTACAGFAVPEALAFRFSDHTRAMPAGAVGQPFSHPVETVAGCKGVHMHVEGGALPPGLRLVGTKRDLVDGSDWRIEGTPTEAGTFGFFIVAKNLCPADSTEEDFRITVVGAPPTAPPPSSARPPGTPRLTLPARPIVPMTRRGASVRRLIATGGVPRLTWRIVSGRLPVGLRLNTANGRLIGRPRHTGRFGFVVRVTDARGTRALRAFVLRVRP